MGTWLMIQNDGLMELESLYLMGASTKRSDNTKLGYWGTGVKNSIACLLRMRIPFHIFIGAEEVHITTRSKVIRETAFDIIRINGQDTSLTIQMAPQWQPWFIIREIYSNAIDEGNPIITVTDHVDYSAEKTRFYVSIEPVIQTVLDKWDRYFCFDRTDLLFESPNDSYPLRIYPNIDISKDLLVYRKGILVMEGTVRAAYSYDMPDAQIDEMRVLKSTWDLKARIAMGWMNCDDADLILELLIALDEWIRKGDEIREDLIEEDAHWHTYDHYINAEAWMKAIGSRSIINASVCGKFLEEQRLNSLILPSDLCKAIADKLPDVPIYGVSNAHGIMFTEVEIGHRENAKLAIVKKALHDMEMDIPQPVKIVKFINESYVGLAKNGIIYLSHRFVMDASIRDIAIAVVEEQTHIITGFEDYSRNMQNYLFNQWITEREARLNKYIF